MSRNARIASVVAVARAVRLAVRPGGPSIGERAGAVPRMVRATFSGEYVGVSKGRLLLMLAAAGYLVSPLDLIPEAVLPDHRPGRRRARAQLAGHPAGRGDRGVPGVGEGHDGRAGRLVRRCSSGARAGPVAVRTPACWRERRRADVPVRERVDPPGRGTDRARRRRALTC